MNLCHPTGPQPKGQKVKRIEKDGVAISDRPYLDWLKTQRCILTNIPPSEFEAVDPAHVGTYAKGMKTDDEALPVRRMHHAKGHNGGEISMFREHAPDWLIRDALRAYARERYREWLEHGEWVGGKFR